MAGPPLTLSACRPDTQTGQTGTARLCAQLLSSAGSSAQAATGWQAGRGDGGHFPETVACGWLDGVPGLPQLCSLKKKKAGEKRTPGLEPDCRFGTETDWTSRAQTGPPQIRINTCSNLQSDPENLSIGSLIPRTSKVNRGSGALSCCHVPTTAGQNLDGDSLTDGLSRVLNNLGSGKTPCPCPMSPNVSALGRTGSSCV